MSVCERVRTHKLLLIVSLVGPINFLGITAVTVHKNVHKQISGAQLALALKEFVGPAAEQRVPSYRKLNYLMLDGKIRTQVINGRRYVAEPDLPVIARMLGLPVPDRDAATTFSTAEHANA